MKLYSPNKPFCIGLVYGLFVNRLIFNKFFTFIFKVHLYSTVWNSLGTSLAGEVVAAMVGGSVPPKPNPGDIVEVLNGCITLRLYAWPEMGCPITEWSVSSKSIQYKTTTLFTSWSVSVEISV